ncbi:MAG: extracellular solute-binding protein [Bdellovibrionota bacterium]
MKYLVSLVALFSLFVGCTKKEQGPTIWIYASFYNHVVQEYDAKLKAKFPNVNFRWYQSGSENIAAKVNSELLSGKTQADLILTADLFWYEDLKAKGVLLKYPSPATSSLAPQFRDPEFAWAVSRVPAMVIAYHSDVYGDAQAPKSFSDLVQPQFKNKVAMGSPLESGTTFTTVAQLSRKLGWDFFKKLRANGAISAGGNSAVMAKIETKERPVGIVLLENIIATRRKNPKIKWVFPKEGIVSVPSPIAITSTTSNPELAKQVYDYFFSKEGQEVLLKGDHHGIFADAPAPEGAPDLTKLLAISLPWNSTILHEVHRERDNIKKQFTSIMLE